jgi:hypothetical protein
VIGTRTEQDVQFSGHDFRPPHEWITIMNPLSLFLLVAVVFAFLDPVFDRMLRSR